SAANPPYHCVLSAFLSPLYLPGCWLSYHPKL
ncbi:hypothetical protein A2U01_0115293, partial [Trifolium medium]|nr:hypothetical protein [Trifolium medium]